MEETSENVFQDSHLYENFEIRHDAMCIDVYSYSAVGLDFILGPKGLFGH